MKAPRVGAAVLAVVACAHGMSIPNPLDTLASGLASICRLPFGVTVISNPSVKIKTLYDVENSRECRKVREALTELDLVVDRVIPAAPNSRCLSDPSFEYGPLTKGSTPPVLILVEEDDEVVLTGADQILNYFETNCGLRSKTGDNQYKEAKQVVFDAGNAVASVMRAGRGSQVSSAAKNAPRPKKPLVLYSYEGNQFCRLVREVLTELDIVYELRNAGKESPRRQELAKASGNTQCPFLLDPNNDVAMPESADIIKYLYKNYGTFTPPSELLRWASDQIVVLVKPLFEATAPALAGSGSNDYEERLQAAKQKLESDIKAAPVVIYTYSLSPFSSEAKSVLDNLEVEYREISLGAEWIPGLIDDSAMRVALFEKTGQSSLPHIFVDGQSIGGLFSGTPGLVPSLEEGSFVAMVKNASAGSSAQVSAFE